MKYGCLAGSVAIAFSTMAHAELVFETTSIDVSPSALAPEITVHYPFQNRGTNAVRITSVRSDCSCTTPFPTKELFAPGEAGEVIVKFEIGSRHGAQKKSVIVATDDPAEPPQVLTLNAALPKVLALSTDNLLWTEGEAPASKSITVRTPEEMAVQVVRGRAQSANLNVEVHRITPTEFRVYVTPRGKARDVSSALHIEAELPGGMIKRSVAFVRVR